MSFQRLIAIDPSLTCSGWALFNLKSKKLIAIGKIKSLPPSYPLGERLLELQESVNKLFKQLIISEKDILVVESATAIIDPKATFKLEQVRGIFETLARHSQATVPGRINPRTIQREVLGLKGVQLKRSIVKDLAAGTAAKIYRDQFDNLKFECSEKNLKRNQDIVDAVLLGHLAVSRYQTAVISGLSIHEIFSDNKDRKKRNQYKIPASSVL